MRKSFLLVLITGIAIMGSSVVFAQAKEENKASTPKPQAAQQPPQQKKADPQQEKQILVNNFSALQNQEARVLVLQQLLNREISELRQMQAIFCDQYNLSVEKWRAGGYQYDMKEGKFIEKPQAAEKK